MRSHLIRGVLSVALLVVTNTSSPPAAPFLSTPKQQPAVTVRGRQFLHVQGQPARNFLRWWFGGVPVAPVPAQ